MCGITGIISFAKEKIIFELLESLFHLQHRGQDSFGLVTVLNNKISSIKKRGLIDENGINILEGNMGIGHVRYRTSGKITIDETQPFIKKDIHTIILSHNGHIWITEKLIKYCEYNKIDINIKSDSELLLNILSHEINKHKILTNDIIKEIIYNLILILEGSFSVILIIVGYGMISFKDRYGIRPLIYGKKNNNYLISSESVSLQCLDYEIIDDIYPGDIIIFRDNKVIKFNDNNFKLKPCIFEWVYLSRIDSVIYNVSVYEARIKMGQLLANKIKNNIDINNIDYVVPIPDSSRPCALSISKKLNIPYIEAIIKNRYTNRTFIMSNQTIRKKNIKRKLNVIKKFINNKNLLIVDDSIVRGNTMLHIVNLLKKNGAKSIVVVSCAPEIKHKNEYGIDIPDSRNLIAYHKNIKEMEEYYNVDKIIYQNLEDLVKSIKYFNKDIKDFELSIFQS